MKAELEVVIHDARTLGFVVGMEVLWIRDGKARVRAFGQEMTLEAGMSLQLNGTLDRGDVNAEEDGRARGLVSGLRALLREAEAT